jgi:hypothetical protein
MAQSDAHSRPLAYVRDDGAEMVEIAPHCYVSVEYYQEVILGSPIRGGSSSIINKTTVAITGAFSKRPAKSAIDAFSTDTQDGAFGPPEKKREREECWRAYDDFLAKRGKVTYCPTTAEELRAPVQKSLADKFNSLRAILAGKAENPRKIVCDFGYSTRDAHPLARSAPDEVKARLMELREDYLRRDENTPSDGSDASPPENSAPPQVPGDWDPIEFYARTRQSLPNPTKNDVLAAFRCRAKKSHPDVGGTADMFRRLVRVRDRILASLARRSPQIPAEEIEALRQIALIRGRRRKDFRRPIGGAVWAISAGREIRLRLPDDWRPGAARRAACRQAAKAFRARAFEPMPPEIEANRKARRDLLNAARKELEARAKILFEHYASRPDHEFVANEKDEYVNPSAAWHYDIAILGARYEDRHSMQREDHRRRTGKVVPLYDETWRRADLVADRWLLKNAPHLFEPEEPEEPEYVDYDALRELRALSKAGATGDQRYPICALPMGRLVRSAGALSARRE